MEKNFFQNVARKSYDEAKADPKTEAYPSVREDLREGLAKTEDSAVVLKGVQKRLGVVALIIDNRDSAQQFNRVVSEFHDLVLARQGVPLHDRYGDGRDLHVISLVVEGTTDALGALTGRLGKLKGVQVKSVLSQSHDAYQEGVPDAHPQPHDHTNVH